LANKILGRYCARIYLFELLAVISVVSPW